MLTHWQLAVNQHAKVTDDCHRLNDALTDADDSVRRQHLAKICLRAEPQDLRQWRL